MGTTEGTSATAWSASTFVGLRVGCSNSNLSRQDKGTFRAASKLSSADPAIILFLSHYKSLDHDAKAVGFSCTSISGRSRAKRARPDHFF